MKILFDTVEQSARDIFIEAFRGHELVFLNTPIHTPEDVAGHEDADILSVFVQSTITQEVVDALPHVKYIMCRSTGYDYVDAHAVSARGIHVANVPTYGMHTVAEFTFALILALSRKAYAAYDRLREEGTTDVKDFEGFNLVGKTIGIVGTGHIGSQVARIAHGFGMKVCAFDIHPQESLMRDVGCVYDTLENIVSQSDIVSVHVPYLPSTHHLINANILSLFKPGSYFINTSRGAVVDTRALVEALREGRLGGAGLDVVEGERDLLDEFALLSDEVHDINQFQNLVAAHTLIDMPNVILTPHIAFNTREAKQEIVDSVVSSIQEYIATSGQS